MVMFRIPKPECDPVIIWRMGVAHLRGGLELELSTSAYGRAPGDILEYVARARGRSRDSDSVAHSASELGDITGEWSHAGHDDGCCWEQDSLITL